MKMKITDLSDGDGAVDIDEAEVVSVGEPRTVNTHFGTEARVAHIKIKDDTGEITLSLWNDDIEKVQVGTFIKISTGYVNSFRGEVKLNVSRYGTLDILRKVKPKATSGNPPNCDVYNNEIYPQIMSNQKPITNEKDLKLLLKETETAEDSHPKLPYVEKLQFFTSRFSAEQYYVDTSSEGQYDSSYTLTITNEYQDYKPNIIKLNQPSIDDSLIIQHKTPTINSGLQFTQPPPHTKINPQLFSNINSFNSLGYYLRAHNRELDQLTNFILLNKSETANSAGQKIALAMIANIAIYFRQIPNPTYYFPWLSTNIKMKDGIKETLIIPIPDGNHDRCAPAIASHFHSILTRNQIWTDIIEILDDEEDTWAIDRGITTELRPDTNINWSKIYNEEDNVDFSNKLEEILLLKITSDKSDKHFGREPYQERFDRLINIYRNNPEETCKSLTSQQQKIMEHTNVVLIDDVVTQGGTTSAYAHIIKEEYKPKNIYVYSASVTRSE